MEVVSFNEEDEDGQADSGPKHWHVFDVIARRVRAELSVMHARLIHCRCR
jgi:hypothetical protein